MVSAASDREMFAQLWFLNLMLKSVHAHPLATIIGLLTTVDQVVISCTLWEAQVCTGYLCTGVPLLYIPFSSSYFAKRVNFRWTLGVHIFIYQTGVLINL